MFFDDLDAVLSRDASLSALFTLEITLFFEALDPKLNLEELHPRKLFFDAMDTCFNIFDAFDPALSFDELRATSSSFSDLK